ncbi:MAG TPA: sirohydrochlorin chelatase [Ectothiorhodospiraceae bacterium]|nr:sirohydrochlorin chelatase [Ectothiorhodospiraceae bacterium]
MNKNDTTILLVGHGSRNREGNSEIEQFAAQWRKKNPELHIVLCFIEFAEVLLDAGLDMAAQSSSKVVVIPLILNAAGHVKMEIPEHIEQARQRHPETEFIFARHLGAPDAILAILKRRLQQTMLALDMPDPKTTSVILLARGSSDRIANGEVAKMARWLYEESDHDLVEIAFTGITHPRLEGVAQHQITRGMGQVMVLPYYLFNGTLIERIKRQVIHLQQHYPTVRFGHSKYFGFEPEIFELLNERVAEAQAGEDAVKRMMECDGCNYRQQAHDSHGHHHHHHDH